MIIYLLDNRMSHRFSRHSSVIVSIQDRFRRVRRFTRWCLYRIRWFERSGNLQVFPGPESPRTTGPFLSSTAVAMAIAGCIFCILWLCFKNLFIFFGDCCYEVEKNGARTTPLYMSISRRQAMPKFEQIGCLIVICQKEILDPKFVSLFSRIVSGANNGKCGTLKHCG